MIDQAKLDQLKENIATKAPLVHNIANGVTINDCANAILAMGARPVMANHIKEVAEVASRADAVVLNLGATEKIEEMILAGEAACQKRIPVVLDPVGAGASEFRNESLLSILKKVRPTVISGNSTEMRALCGLYGLVTPSKTSSGVDAKGEDKVTTETMGADVRLFQVLAETLSTMIAVSGPIDLICTAEEAVSLRGGSSWMERITGTGCMLSACIRAVLGANPNRQMDAVLYAHWVFAQAGERASLRCLEERRGTGTFRSAFIDEISQGLCLDQRSDAIRQEPPFTSTDLTLYAITDTRWLGEETLENAVAQVLEGGATFLQLRDKSAKEKELIEMGKALKILCRKYCVPFVVNDSIAIALKIGASGVHLGQSEVCPESRAQLGEGKILGITANTVELALEAQRMGADYIGVGAVFQTGTKDDAKAIDHKTLADICHAVSIPVVAIGGITAENAAELTGLGPRGIAVVSALFAAKDKKKAACEMLAIAQQIRGG